jgi:alkyldihydroxyacetonephosphate synthase
VLDDGRDARAALPRKSYLDLLAQRAGDCEDAPDAVVAPAERRGACSRARRVREAGVAVVPFGGGTSVGRRPRAAARRHERSSRSTSAAGGDRVVRRALAARLAGRRHALPEADHALGQRGYMLGHTPQSYEWATVGGCVATRSRRPVSTGHGGSRRKSSRCAARRPHGELANCRCRPPRPGRR